jgi:hypothetical protein
MRWIRVWRVAQGIMWMKRLERAIFVLVILSGSSWITGNLRGGFVETVKDKTVAPHYDRYSVVAKG